MSELADTYGYPGPEGPHFWGFLGVIAATIFVLVVTQPLLPPGLTLTA